MVKLCILYPAILIQEFGEHAALLLELRWQVTRLSKAQGFLMELHQFLSEAFPRDFPIFNGLD